MTVSYRLGIDIGGTFSDFAVIDDADGAIRVGKTLTSAHAPEESVMRGVADLSGAIPGLLGRTSEVIHATTLVTNTILERKGAKTGLLTTEGFRDILELAREVRYDIYDMFIRLPEPLVPRRLRLGIPERVLADGAVLHPLDEAAVRRAAAVFRDEGVEAVAVSFLHSYRNSVHERRAAEILREELPAATLSLSHEVHPEPKEYERTSTTVLDAYVKAVTEGYLERLAVGLAGRGYRDRLCRETVSTARRTGSIHRHGCGVGIGRRFCRETVSTARRTGSIHRHGCGVGIGRRFWRGRDERWTSPIWPEAGPAQPCGVMRADQAALGSAAFTGAT